MTEHTDLTTLARDIIDSNLYMTLGTADDEGRPWVSPVYFAPVAYREYLWVSRPTAQHSRNIETRSDISVVIFDSKVPISTGQAVYISATAERVADDDVDGRIDVFTRRSLSHGGSTWNREGVTDPAELRLYRAIASVIYVVNMNDRRIEVDLQ